MSGLPLVLSSFGLITGVGLDAPSTCAAIRCAIDAFDETRFMDAGGEWIMGCEVPLEQPWRGKTKLIKMAAKALRETLEQSPDIDPERTPLMLCLAESDRPGRIIDDDNAFFFDLCAELGVEFHPRSRVISQGHVSIGAALLQARKLIADDVARQVLVAATDSLLVAPTLASYEERDRLLTSQNSNGFIPGEAGAAMVVRASGRSEGPGLMCTGIGSGVEHATVDSEEPLRADGLVTAFRAALADAGCDMGDMDFRITDVAGEQYHFKEASLALSRTLRIRKEEFDIWHPADCIGEVGAAAGLVSLVVGAYAGEKDYSKGRGVLFHFGNDDGKRVAMTAMPSAGAG
jgi:3-oxoacyl-[acyl-carrier-protein] synthase-1